MQATTRFHDGIATAILQETSRVFDQMVALHPANGGFDPEANGRDRTSGCLLRWGECAPRGLLLRLDDRDPLARLAREAQSLIQTTATGAGLAFQSRAACILGLPFRGSTPEAEMTGLLEEEEGFERLAFLLATIIVLLSLWIGWAVDWSRRTIRPHRGDPGTPGVRLAARLTPQSAAVRAGSRSWWAKA